MTPDALPAFETGPELVDLDITEETVSKTAGAGAGGTDSETIVSRQLKFGTYSQRIRYAIHSIWETHNMEEGLDVLLISARNAFTEINRTVML